MPTADILSHKLVPEHVIVPEDEVDDVLEELNAVLIELPKILSRDPIIKAIGGKSGDVVKIIRKSPTAGEAIAYRLVVQG